MTQLTPKRIDLLQAMSRARSKIYRRPYGAGRHAMARALVRLGLLQESPKHKGLYKRTPLGDKVLGKSKKQ